MPNYSYKCDNCGNNFTHFHGMNDVLTECTVCTASALKKLPSLISSYSPDRVKEGAGQRVKEFIEDHRKLLVEERETSKKEYK